MMLNSPYKLPTAILLILAVSGVFAAERHNLRTDPQLLGRVQKASTVADQHAAFGLSQAEKLELLRTTVDSNGVSHSRYRQTIGGVPVWGEQIVISRSPSGKVAHLHGRLVKGLASELSDFTPALRSEEALSLMKDRFRKGNSADGVLLFENESVELVVYLDGKTPLLSYAVSFFSDIDTGGKPSRPTFLIDASSGEVLFEYEGLTHTESLKVQGSGPGGNDKTDYYDYAPELNSYLDVLYSDYTCTMENTISTVVINDTTEPPVEKTVTTTVTTVDLNHGTIGSTPFSYSCQHKDDESESAPFPPPYPYSYSYYNEYKEINTALSPINDAHYFGSQVVKMYHEWVDSNPLTFDLMMRVHYGVNYENAFWNGSSVTFGDGDTIFYPLVSLDVVAHEVSHGFTEQNSGLIYSGQSGGINEAYSDMAGEAAEFFARKENDFKVGAEIYKELDKALRYMDNPPEDGISIDHIDDYYYGMDVHYSSGIYNKAFYTLANTVGWDTQSAFELFAYANKNLWTPSTSFRFGAFAVRDAIDFVFPEEEWPARKEDVETAFSVVGINLGPMCDESTTTSLNEDNTFSSTFDGGEGSYTCFKINVPADTESLTLTLTEPPPKGRWKTYTGDPDLYLRFDDFPDPSNPESGVETNDEKYDCRSISPGGNESCIINSPATGNWYSLVYGWSDYTNITIEAILEPTPSDGTSDGTEVHVHDLDGTASLQGKKWSATVTITVRDDSETPVPDATVSGSWEDVSDSGSCTTDSSGSCTIKKSRLNTTSVKFTVSDVTAAEATYVDGPHEDPDSDSEIFGTINGYITVLAP